MSGAVWYNFGRWSEGANTRVSGERKFSPLSSAHMLCCLYSWLEARGFLVVSLSDYSLNAISLEHLDGIWCAPRPAHHGVGENAGDHGLIERIERLKDRRLLRKYILL